MELVTLLARWLHILAASLTVGVPIFIRFVLWPSLATLDEAHRPKLQEESTARWRNLIYLSIAIFLVTGLYNFFWVARWRSFRTGGSSPLSHAFRHQVHPGSGTVLRAVRSGRTVGETGIHSRQRQDLGHGRDGSRGDDRDPIRIHAANAAAPPTGELRLL